LKEKEYRKKSRIHVVVRIRSGEPTEIRFHENRRGWPKHLTVERSQLLLKFRRLMLKYLGPKARWLMPEVLLSVLKRRFV